MANTLTKRSGRLRFAGVTARIPGGYGSLSGIAALSDDDTPLWAIAALTLDAVVLHGLLSRTDEFD